MTLYMHGHKLVTLKYKLYERNFRSLIVSCCYSGEKYFLVSLINYKWHDLCEILTYNEHLNNKKMNTYNL